MAHVGSKALWQPDTLRELYCAFAEPHAIGLSSIAGLVHPVARGEPDGVVVRLSAPGESGVDRAGPDRAGVVTPMGIQDVRSLRVGEPTHRDRPRHRRGRRRA